MNKVYWQIGPFEIQWGRVSRHLAIFWRRRWKRLMVIDLSWLT